MLTIAPAEFGRLARDQQRERPISAATPEHEPEQERAERAPAPPAATSARRAPGRCCSGTLRRRPARARARSAAARHSGSRASTISADLGRLGQAPCGHSGCPARNGRCACRAPSPHGRWRRSTAAACRPRDAAVEQVDVRGDFREQRVERVVEEFEPRHFGVAQIDDNAGALGRLDARLAQGVLQPLGASSSLCRLDLGGSFSGRRLRPFGPKMLRPGFGRVLAVNRQPLAGLTVSPTAPRGRTCPSSRPADSSACRSWP